MRSTQLNVPVADIEIAADRLRMAGARAIEERDGSDGRAVLCTVLADSDDVSLQRLGDLPGDWNLGFVDSDPAPVETWRDFAAPVLVGEELVITPAWNRPLSSTARLEVVIEPGASFGLGDHPTTRLSAAAALRLVTPGARVLDVGCGSGVLAIISALLGASPVVAIDIAEAAREATIANSARNGVSEQIAASTLPLSDIDGQFDIVFANILAPTLVALSGDLLRVLAPGGTMVISGVLEGRHDHVLRSLKPLVAEHTQVLDGWAAVSLC